MYINVVVEVAPTFVVPDEVMQEDETLGTKPKFWFDDAGGRRRLFKRSPRFGEDWSEWLAARLAHRLGVPAAEVEFAEHRGRSGVIATSFLAPGDQMFHGNELLAGRDPDYPVLGVRKVLEYTVQACLQALAEVGAQARGVPPFENAGDQWAGYLLLDAWIGNSDRHHENWAVLRHGASTWLAPSYDHAASLGRNLPVEKVERRLTEVDPRVTVAAFCKRARSAFFGADGKALHPAAAFETAARLRPAAGAYWRAQLAAVDEDAIEDELRTIPAERITEPHRAFAGRMLACNRRRLLEARSSDR